MPKNWINFSDFKQFLINFGFANTPDNSLSPDYKLTHELWKSLSRYDSSDQAETVPKKHLLAVVQAIVGLTLSENPI